MKMECLYRKTQVVSSMALNGICYKGEAAKNKKEVEQLVAFAAILSRLDDPTYTTPLSDVIKFKFNVGAAFYESKNTTNPCFTDNKLKTSLISRPPPIEQRNSRVLVNKTLP